MLVLCRRKKRKIVCRGRLFAAVFALFRAVKFSDRRLEVLPVRRKKREDGKTGNVRPGQTMRYRYRLNGSASMEAAWLSGSRLLRLARPEASIGQIP